MHILHQGFDGFDVTIAANIPIDFARHLEKEKLKAQQQKCRSLTEYNSCEFYVRENGVTGGYAYSLDRGPFAYNLFIKKPNPSDPYGLRASFASLPLAIYGLRKCYETLQNDLAKMGCKIQETDILMGRADYCFDFLMDDFFIDPHFFVHHARIKGQSEYEKTENSCGERIYNCRVGKMPHRQASIYDKRKDVLDKRKEEWWKIWNTNLKKQNLPLINKENSKDRIWRIELRLGKEAMRKNNIKIVEDFFLKGGSAYLDLLDKIRYTSPLGNDNKRNRWPDSPEWVFIRNQIETGLSEMTGSLDEESILKIKRDQLEETLLAQTFGSALSYGVATKNIPEDPDLFCEREFSEFIAKELRERLADKRQTLPKKLGEIRDRQMFIAD